MSAQATSAEGADLQGTGQRQGIATQSVQLNGVSATERTPQGPGGSGVQRLENPNVHDPNPGTVRQPVEGHPASGQMFLGVAEPPYGTLPDTGANVINQGSREPEVSTPVRGEVRSASTPTRSAVRVQEFLYG